MVVLVVVVEVIVAVVVLVGGSGGSSSGSGSSSLIKFTGKLDKKHETDNETHIHAPRIYTLMYPNVLNHHI